MKNLKDDRLAAGESPRNGAQTHLRLSGVVFDEAAHTYTLNGKRLQGITGMIGRRLFPDMYRGVSDDVLKRAAAYGSKVHKACEDFDGVGEYVFGDDDLDLRDDLLAYVNVKAMHDLVHEASEYIVTDGEHFASCIDKVYFKDGVYDLADIKTTSTLHKEYVSWQLSIYAYLFELQNPDKHVGRLYAIHIKNGDAKLVEVERKPSYLVENLLKAEVEGQEVTDCNAFPDADLEAELYRVSKLAKHYTTKMEELKARIMDDMIASGAAKWESERVQVVRKGESVSTRFDSKRFEADHAELYAQYTKETKTKASITIKLKTDE